MKTDTADQHWNTEWAGIEAGSKWLVPEDDVKDWAAGFARGAKVLDLGAGVGRHALWLAAQGFEAIALDAAPEGLAEIDKAGGVKTVLARMDKLPFEDNEFDHIVSWNVIYHGDEDILLKTIAEIRRVLKPGGTIWARCCPAAVCPMNRQSMRATRSAGTRGSSTHRAPTRSTPTISARQRNFWPCSAVLNV